MNENKTNINWLITIIVTFGESLYLYSFLDIDILHILNKI
jgi:abortive infection bacteriophage resistance protein